MSVLVSYLGRPQVSVEEPVMSAGAVAAAAARFYDLNPAGLYVLQPVSPVGLGATLGLEDPVPDGEYVLTPWTSIP